MRMNFAKFYVIIVLVLVTVNLMKKLIRRRYFTNWIVDKLPAGLIVYNQETKQTSLKYFNGIPLGYHKDRVFYIYIITINFIFY